MARIIICTMKMRRIIAGTAVLGAVALAACGARGVAGWAVDRMVATEFEDVEQIDTETLNARLEASAPPLVLDIRTADEFAHSHLPGAVRIDPDADPGEVLGALDRDRPIVVYCSVGYRSSAFAQRMQAAGFTRVSNLEGSIFRWVNEGRPLVDNQGHETQRVHPYGSPWDFLVSPDNRAPLD